MSITTSAEYLQYLYVIQDKNFPQLLATDIPKDEEKLIIDLNTRTITAPEFLSVTKDHNSETLYFMVDRYFDGVDLATMSCIVQFKNANPDKTKNNGYVYAVPQYFLIAPEGEQKLIFPWVIEGPATAYSGIVTFAVKFYRLNGEWNEDENLNSLEYEYNLNTLTAKSRVLEGLDVLENNPDYSYDTNPTLFENVLERLLRLEQIQADKNTLYWIELGS